MNDPDEMPLADLCRPLSATVEPRRPITGMGAPMSAARARSSQQAALLASIQRKIGGAKKIRAVDIAKGKKVKGEQKWQPARAGKDGPVILSEEKYPSRWGATLAAREIIAAEAEGEQDG